MVLSCLPELPATTRNQDNAEAVAEFGSRLKLSTDAVMQPGLYTEAVIALCNAVHEDPKLSRFPELQQHLSAGAIQHEMEETLMFAKLDVDSMVKTTLQQICNTALPAAELQHVLKKLNALKDRIGSCMVKRVFQCLRTTALLVDDKDTRQLRIKYTEDIKRYSDVGLACNRIKKQF